MGGTVWSSEAINFFSTQVLGKTVMLELKAKVESVYKINLYIKTQDLAQLLCKEEYARKEVELPLARIQLEEQPVVMNGAAVELFNKQPARIDFNDNREHSMIVTHTQSPFLFYGQLDSELSNFTKFEVALNAFYENLLQQSDIVHLSKPVVGDKCIARYSEDGCWYRAVVKEIDLDLDEVVVQFLDYGNEDIVKLSSKGLLVINKQFKEYPVAAVKCCLYGIKQLEESAVKIKPVENALNFMHNETASEAVFVKFRGKASDDCWYVDVRIRKTTPNGEM
jgi:tudor domain-containing protein 1/4/6/7